MLGSQHRDSPKLQCSMMLVPTSRSCHFGWNGTIFGLVGSWWNGTIFGLVGSLGRSACWDSNIEIVRSSRCHLVTLRMARDLKCSISKQAAHLRWIVCSISWEQQSMLRPLNSTMFLGTWTLLIWKSIDNLNGVCHQSCAFLHGPPIRSFETKRTLVEVYLLYPNQVSNLCHRCAFPRRCIC